jgi:hypothetical protein
MAALVEVGAVRRLYDEAGIGVPAEADRRAEIERCMRDRLAHVA